MRFCIVVCLGLYPLLIAAAVAEQGRYYVSAAWDDNAPGTEAKPFATIQKAIDVAQPGDLIYVRDRGGRSI